jgi:hypothetical protein
LVQFEIPGYSRILKGSVNLDSKYFTPERTEKAEMEWDGGHLFYGGTHSLVYLHESSGLGVPVAIKVLKDEHPGPAVINPDVAEVEGAVRRSRPAGRSKASRVKLY